MSKLKKKLKTQKVKTQKVDTFRIPGCRKSVQKKPDIHIWLFEHADPDWYAFHDTPSSHKAITSPVMVVGTVIATNALM